MFMAGRILVRKRAQTVAREQWFQKEMAVPDRTIAMRRAEAAAFPVHLRGATPLFKKAQCRIRMPA
jgi:hypothetical protein